MSQLSTAPAMASAAPEAEIIAREMAGAFRGMVEHYRQTYNLPGPEALARAEAPADPAYLQWLVTGPAHEVSWCDLEALAQQDPQLAMRRWEEVKEAAREELHSGHRAANVLEAAHSHPWARARFIALYQELEREWQPRNGIERQLIQTMVLAQSSMLWWLEKLTLRSSLDSRDPEKEGGTRSGWTLPRLSDAEAVEQAGGMMDRFNRLFLRTLRALRDLRRYPVIVQNAGQVNIGQQQVNVSGRRKRKGTSRSGRNRSPCECRKK